MLKGLGTNGCHLGTHTKQFRWSGSRQEKYSSHRERNAENGERTVWNENVTHWVKIGTICLTLISNSTFGIFLCIETLK